jgi:hypothetical protein
LSSSLNGSFFILRCFDCATFLYDPKRKTVCFKSFTSWLLVFSAYLLLFATLAGFWAFTYWMVYPWNLEMPKTYGEKSILGRNPGKSASLGPKAVTGDPLQRSPYFRSQCCPDLREQCEALQVTCFQKLSLKTFT